MKQDTLEKLKKINLKKNKYIFLQKKLNPDIQKIKYDTIYTGLEIECADLKRNDVSKYAEVFGISTDHSNGKDKKEMRVQIDPQTHVLITKDTCRYEDHQDVTDVYNDGSTPIEIVTRPFAVNELEIKLKEILKKVTDAGLKPDYVNRGKAGTHLTLMLGQHPELSQFDPLVVTNLIQLTRAYLPSITSLFGRMGRPTIQTSEDFDIAFSHFPEEEEIEEYNCECECPCNNCTDSSTCHHTVNCNLYSDMRPPNNSQQIQKIEGMASRKTYFRFLPLLTHAKNPFNSEKYCAINVRVRTDEATSKNVIWAIEIRTPDGVERVEDLVTETRFWHAMLQYSAKVSQYGELKIKQLHFDKSKKFWSSYSENSIPSSKLKQWQPFAVDLLYLLRHELIKNDIIEETTWLLENPLRDKKYFKAVDKSNLIEQSLMGFELKGEEKEKILQETSKQLKIPQMQVMEFIDQKGINLL